MRLKYHKNVFKHSCPEVSPTVPKSDARNPPRLRAREDLGCVEGEQPQIQSPNRSSDHLSLKTFDGFNACHGFNDVDSFNSLNVPSSEPPSL